MHAVIATGGKQYRVTTDQILTLEKIEASIGDVIKLDQLLLVSDEHQLTTDQAKLQSSHVEAEVLEHGRLKKVHIMKFKRRKHYMKQQGHRQYYTKVKIRSIQHGT